MSFFTKATYQVKFPVPFLITIYIEVVKCCIGNHCDLTIEEESCWVRMGLSPELCLSF